MPYTPFNAVYSLTLSHDLIISSVLLRFFPQAGVLLAPLPNITVTCGHTSWILQCAATNSSCSLRNQTANHYAVFEERSAFITPTWVEMDMAQLLRSNSTENWNSSGLVCTVSIPHFVADTRPDGTLLYSGDEFIMTAGLVLWACANSSCGKISTSNDAAKIEAHIAAPVVTHSVYAINGRICSPCSLIDRSAAADTNITFELTFSVAIARFRSIQLLVWLPFPFLDGRELDVSSINIHNNHSSNSPSVGSIMIGNRTTVSYNSSNLPSADFRVSDQMLSIAVPGHFSGSESVHGATLQFLFTLQATDAAIANSVLVRSCF